MRRFIELYRDFVRLGDDLRKDLPVEIQQATGKNWDPASVQRIRNDFVAYSSVVSRLALWLAALASVPLIFVIIFVVQHKPHTGFYAVCYDFSLVCFWILGFAALRLVWPIVFLSRVLKQLPAAYYREFVWSGMLSLDALNILINAGLFFYLFASVDASTSLPVMLLIVGLWLFAPLLAYMAGKDAIFIKVRVWQLGALLVAALLISISPIPVKNFQWWASREAAKSLRPVEQEEITSSWATLQWFTPEGQPNVWYSSSANRGYHLFGSPGYDTATAQELKPVGDKETKDMIVAALAAQKSVQDRQEALDAQKRQGALAELQAKQSADALQQTIRAYVRNATAAPSPIALIVLDSGRPADTALGEQLAKVLADAGVSADASVFTPAFAGSPAFRDVLAGRPVPNGAFHSETYAARLVVVQVSTAITSQEPVQGVAMLAADVTWKVQLVACADGRVENSFEVKARGVGFGESEARKNATERASADFKKLAPSLLR